MLMNPNHRLKTNYLTMLLGTGESGRILSKIGWRPCLIAKVSVNSGRTVNNTKHIKDINKPVKCFRKRSYIVIAQTVLRGLLLYPRA
jgi:hypothetical protein